MYKIDYFKQNEGMKKIIIDLDGIVHNVQNVYVKDKIKECKECKYNNICLKMNIKQTDNEDIELAKQFLNEAIIDCPHYHKINSNSSVNVIKPERMFSDYLNDEMEKRKKALQGVELN